MLPRGRAAFFEGGFAGFLSEAPPAPPTRRAPPRLGAGDHRSPLRGARRPGAPFPSHISRLGISAAWHRRRAGMLGRFAGSCGPITARRRHEPPYWGGMVGEAPPPFLSHRFLSERKRCPGRVGPPREGAPARRATTGRPYGRRAESSRPTDSGGWAGIREPLIRPERSGRCAES